MSKPGTGFQKASESERPGEESTIDPMKDINWYPFALSYADTSKDPEGASGFQRRLARRSTGQVKVAGFRLPWWGWVLFGLAVIVPLGAGLVAKRRQTRWKRIARGEP